MYARWEGSGVLRRGEALQGDGGGGGGGTDGSG